MQIMLQLLCGATLLLLALNISSVIAANPATEFLGFGTAVSDSIIQNSDDEAVKLMFPFAFYGTNYSTIHVCCGNYCTI